MDRDKLKRYRIKLLCDFAYMFRDEIDAINSIKNHAVYVYKRKMFISNVVVYFVPYASSADAAIWKSVNSGLKKINNNKTYRIIDNGQNI